uniref:Short chain dehydrogenase/reductase family 39U, member 1 n=1 Tax=Mus musculus TaxID=10090 RepID=A0A2I3BQD5_MOUSE
MRVLVGGGTGFIGTAVTQLLRGRGHEVKLVSRQPGPGRITWSELNGMKPSKKRFLRAAWILPTC